jgi:hypothetical protein
MRQRVLEILEAARRRLVLVRAAESAAVTASSAAVAAAMVQAAWLAPGPWLAAALSVLVGAAGVAAMLVPAARAALRLTRPLAMAAGAAAGAVGLAGAALAAAGAGASAKLLVLTAIPAGGLAAFAVVAARGLPLWAVARLMDGSLGARERLATAVELAGSPAADSPSAQTIYAQSLAVLGSPAAVNMRFWSRTPATAAALGLAVLLAVAMAVLAGGEKTGLLAQWAQGFEQLTPAQRAQLANQLENAARQGDDASLREALLAAARAARENDPAAFRQFSSEADAAAEAARRQLTIKIDLGLGGSGLPPAVGSATQATGPDERTTRPAGGGTVLVYSPLYAPSGTGGAAGGPDGPIAEAPFDAAWSAARARAERSVAAGTLPPQYRQLVRDFFANE